MLPGALEHHLSLAHPHPQGLALRGDHQPDLELGADVAHQAEGGPHLDAGGAARGIEVHGAPLELHRGARGHPHPGVGVEPHRLPAGEPEGGPPRARSRLEHGAGVDRRPGVEGQERSGTLSGARRQHPHRAADQLEGGDRRPGDRQRLAGPGSKQHHPDRHQRQEHGEAARDPAGPSPAGGRIFERRTKAGLAEGLEDRLGERELLATPGLLREPGFLCWMFHR